ncbi:MAG: DUF4296 domain-containing protein [Paludibacter sp.]|nr:DUF4296 domain-containing protein [Paludibacter sp.]
MINSLSKSFSKLFFTFICIAFLAACGGRPSGVLNKNDMTEVLTDLHKLDGSLAAKGILYGNSDEKNAYYSSVLKKHGITQAQFDSSLVWYTKNPKKFDDIYIKVLANLTDLGNDIKKGKYHSVDSTELAKIKYNIWNKRFKYVLTKDSARTRLDFEIQDQGFLLADVYVLKFTQRIAPEDSCDEPVIRFQINYLNGGVHGVIKTAYHDGITRRYMFRLTSTHPYKIKSISGQLLGSSAYKGKFNATVDSITLTRIYNPTKQDSIMKILQKTDSVHYKKPAPIFVPQAVRTRNIRSLILRK